MGLNELPHRCTSSVEIAGLTASSSPYLQSSDSFILGASVLVASISGFISFLVSAFVPRIRFLGLYLLVALCPRPLEKYWYVFHASNHSISSFCWVAGIVGWVVWKGHLYISPTPTRVLNLREHHLLANHVTSYHIFLPLHTQSRYLDTIYIIKFILWFVPNQFVAKTLGFLKRE